MQKWARCGFFGAVLVYNGSAYEEEGFGFMNMAIVLAAGFGTRMKSKKSKVLHTILGQPMLTYVLDGVKGATFSQTIVICGENEEALKAEYVNRDVSFVRQPTGEGFPYGTGYAVMQAKEQITDDVPVLIMAGDVPMVRTETLKSLLDLHLETGNTATVLTALLDDLKGYGRIIKDADGYMTGIVEDRDCTPEQKLIKEVNSGIFIVQGEALKSALDLLSADNDQNEYYVTDIFATFAKESKKVGTYALDDGDEILGINSKAQLAQVENLMRKRINIQLMEDGVIIENPETVLIGPGVSIGQDTRIEQNVRITGETSIGADCVIGQGSVVRDCTIGDRVQIRSSELEESTVKDDVKMGPFAHLRPKCIIGEHVHLGNFVEIKNSTIAAYSKAGHLAYVGDADVGEHVNIGCGVVFVNYDGVKKHRSTIGSYAFVGSNANVVAPVVIGEKGYVAAGSTITIDVPAGSLSIERAKQANIEGWVERKFGKNREVSE